MHVKILQKKCGSQIGFYLYMFRCITLKQLNSLTTIHSLSFLGGQVVTHKTTVPEVLGSILRIYKEFCLLCFCCDLTLVQKQLHVFVMKCCHLFGNVISFSILNILRSLWPVIRVPRYRRSISNKNVVFMEKKKRHYDPQSCKASLWFCFM